ncbi:MAG: hypothetical protein L6Q45_01690 [Anaerolineales bacterium]|nr:hypothetical protein [Anaerolineales bacterium]
MSAAVCGSANVSGRRRIPDQILFNIHREVCAANFSLRLRESQLNLSKLTRQSLPAFFQRERREAGEFARKTCLEPVERLAFRATARWRAAQAFALMFLPGLIVNLKKFAAPRKIFAMDMVFKEQYHKTCRVRKTCQSSQGVL